MKKTAILLLLAALLVSCSGGEAKTTADTQAAAEVQAAETTGSTAAVKAEYGNDGYVCVLDNGVQIRLGAPADDVIPTLGEPTDYMEAPSCVFDGMDKIYTFDNAYSLYVVHGADGREYIHEFNVISDAVAMVVGDTALTIGSSVDDLIAAFGEPEDESYGVYNYNVPGGKVTAVTMDGEIASFGALYPLE